MSWMSRHSRWPESYRSYLPLTGGIVTGATTYQSTLTVTGRLGSTTTNASAQINAQTTSTSDNALRTYNNSNSYTGDSIYGIVRRAANAAFNVLRLTVNDGADPVLKVTGAGQATCDGLFIGGGADYAEMFEWADGNPDNEDRIGLSVALDGEKIRPAKRGESPIGIVSARPVVLGDAHDLAWQGKWLTDDYGRRLTERVKVYRWVESVIDGHPVIHDHYEDQVPKGLKVPRDAEVHEDTRWVRNPDHDPSIPYAPRKERPEWAAVGLMGKLRMKPGQPTDSRWRKLSAGTTELWLVR